MSGNDILFDKFTGSGYAGSNTQLFCKYAASAKTVGSLESMALDLAKQVGQRFTGAGKGVGTRVVESSAAGVKPGSTGLVGKADELVNKLGGPKVTGSAPGTPGKPKTPAAGTQGKPKTKTPTTGNPGSGTTPPKKDGTSVKTDPGKPAGPKGDGKQGGNGGGKDNGNNGGKDGKEKEELGALKALGIGAGLSAVGAAGAYGVHRYTREKDDKYSFLNN